MLGIIAGALVSVPVFYVVFLRNGPANSRHEQYPMPGATIWQAVAEVLTQGPVKPAGLRALGSADRRPGRRRARMGSGS